MFVRLRGVEIYKTTGFKDIALIYGDTEKSYQKTARLINRIRHQEQGGTPSRTLHDCTEKEGREALSYIDQRARCILKENGFTEDGKCRDIKLEYKNKRPVTLPNHLVLKTVGKCCQDQDINVDVVLMNPVPYENPENSTEISIDDVNVKKQEEFRPGGIKSERGKRKYIHNTIAHISKADAGKYTLNGPGTKIVLRFLTAFWFHNGLTGDRIQFFTDGHKVLNDSIFKWFSWYENIGIILDWYHLEKKCKEQLSLALTGRFIRNEILDKLKPLLWYGLVDEAVNLLESIDQDSIKKIETINKLIEYLIRNKPHIPCYAVRKELGLCNSSAIGEKMNDLVVSSRQKHNGMSWSKAGSVGLATITAIKRNRENEKWFETKSLNFKLVA